MKFKEGDLVKSVLSGKIYKIENTRDSIVTLDSLDGSSQVLTEENNLNLFYEGLKNLKTPSDSKNRGLGNVHELTHDLSKKLDLAQGLTSKDA